MHRIWQIPELLVHIISFLPAADIDVAFEFSSHFRTTLKANLPPCLRPLPDSPNKTSIRNQTLPQDVRDKATAFGTSDSAFPDQFKMIDTYYYWREDAKREVLGALKPHLHPAVSRYATCLIDGYESLAAGRVNMALQVEIPYHKLYELVQGEGRDDCEELLFVKPPTAVTVFCLGGVTWDLLYADVRYQEYGSIKRFAVRVEREDGVRLRDVLEELGGTLVVDGMSGGLGQDVTLVLELDSGTD